MTEPLAASGTQVSDVDVAWAMAEMEKRWRETLDGRLQFIQLRNEDVRRLATDLDRALRDLDAFKRKVVNAILEKAASKGWCDEAEDFIDDELGLGDLLSREVEIEVAFTLSVGARGRQLDQDAVDAAAHRFIDNELCSNHWRIID